jgi:hypothetical protein
MPNPPLDIADLSASVALIPGAIDLLGCSSELHDEVPREVLQLGLAPFFAPEPNQGGFIVAHDDPCVLAADEETALRSRNVRESNFAF